MTPFGFAGPRETLFGRGSRNEAAAHIARRGRRVVLVRSRSVAWAADLRSGLEAAGLTVIEAQSRGEPTIDHLRAQLERCRRRDPDCVAAVGGGSAIDLGKALAALLPTDADPLAHLEVVGEGRPIGHAPLPLIAIPTTAGTGAEATKNAVISIPEQALKVSLRDERMIPDLAVVDPALTDGAPREITLASGLDAVTQLIESYLSIRANPVTDALCRDGIPAGLAALGRLMQGEDPAARDALARASHLSGLALANAGLGVAHGLAAVIGGRGGAHGAICGRLLPATLEINERAARSAGLATERFAQIEKWFADAFRVEESSGIRSLRGFLETQGLPSLTALGVDPADYEAVAHAALRASSTKANPVRLALADVVDILRRS